MNVVELSNGREYDVELSMVGRPDVRMLRRGVEVLLSQSSSDEPWLTCEWWNGPVRGRRRGDRDLLDDLLGRQRVILCWITSVAGGADHVSVHIHVFEQAQRWTTASRVDIAVDGKIQDDVARRAVGTPNRSTRDPLDWLRMEFLLPPLVPDMPVRLVVSGSADRSVSLHGRQYVLDVLRREDGTCSPNGWLVAGPTLRTVR